MTGRMIICKIVDSLNRTESLYHELRLGPGKSRYRARWKVELFFRWIKQHLRIKSFYGTSENAVKTQAGVALSVYVLVAIVKKQLGRDLSLYKILQILSVTVFEKTPILEGFSNFSDEITDAEPCIQLNLFDF
jgi:DDE family transposase